ADSRARGAPRARAPRSHRWRSHTPRAASTRRGATAPRGSSASKGATWRASREARSSACERASDRMTPGWFWTTLLAVTIAAAALVVVLGHFWLRAPIAALAPYRRHFPEARH